MNHPYYLLPALLMLVDTARAIDFTVTTNQWQPDYSGRVGQNTNTATFEELGFDDDDHNVVTAVLRHPVPVIPNIKIQRTELDTQATGTLVRNFTFDDITYTAAEGVATDLDLTHTDITFFYTPVSNWITFDIGLTGRNFDGGVDIVGDTSGSENVELDDWLPMIYLGTRFELPLTGLYLDFIGNAISADDDEVTDFSAVLGYQTAGVGVSLVAELGYRSFSLDIKDIDDVDGLEGDLDIEGLYFTLGLSF